MAWQHLIWPQFTDVLLKLLVTGTVSVLVWFALGAEVKLERASEKCPIWCAHKDVLRLNKRNSLAVVSGVAKPSPAPALIALNIFNALNWKKLIACVNALILTFWYISHIYTVYNISVFIIFSYILVIIFLYSIHYLLKALTSPFCLFLWSIKWYQMELQNLFRKICSTKSTQKFWGHVRNQNL